MKDIIINKNGKVELRTPKVYKVTVFECRQCKHQLETDIPIDKAGECSDCGAIDWAEKRNMGKHVAKDKTAPEELIAEQEAGK